MLYACERCKIQTAKLDKCYFCEKMVCESCKKSAKRVSKVQIVMICKSCWTNMEKRKKFKSL